MKPTELTLWLLLLAGFMLFGLGWSVGRFNAVTEQASQVEPRSIATKSHREVLDLYVRFVQSEYGVPWEAGPCETLSRAQLEAIRRQKIWAEYRRPASEPLER